MSLAQRLPLERFFFGAAVASVAASAAWWWLQQPLLRRVQVEPAAAALPGAAYEPQSLAATPRSPQAWAKPAAQSHGAGWVYEVFTPPVIYYHAAVRSFTVTPPMAMAEAKSAFGLELLDVKLEPYRLQLVGYVGRPDDYIAAFVSPRLPETLLARAGRHFEELGLTLEQFALRKLPAVADESAANLELAAIATLRDERTGERITLDSRQRKLTDTPLAVLRLGSSAKPREFREGDIFQDQTAIYRIDRIQLDPPEVLVAREAIGLPYPETRVLKPVDPAKVARRGAPSTPRFPTRAQPAVVSAETKP